MGRSPEQSSGLEGRQEASQVWFGIYSAPPTRLHCKRHVKSSRRAIAALSRVGDRFSTQAGDSGGGGGLSAGVQLSVQLVLLGMLLGVLLGCCWACCWAC